MIHITAPLIITNHSCTLVKGMGSFDSVGVSEINNTFKKFSRDDFVIYLEISSRTCLTTKSRDADDGEILYLLATPSRITVPFPFEVVLHDHTMMCSSKNTSDLVSFCDLLSEILCFSP